MCKPLCVMTWIIYSNTLPDGQHDYVPYFGFYHWLIQLKQLIFFFFLSLGSNNLSWSSSALPSCVTHPPGYFASLCVFSPCVNPPHRVPPPPPTSACQIGFIGVPALSLHYPHEITSFVFGPFASVLDLPFWSSLIFFTFGEKKYQ